ncbi:MAG: 2,3-bisphosphoglycerate-independent phosphoglycerate mutase [Polyangiales bacterium]
MADFSLKRHPTFAGVKGPVLTVVMDGVGIGPKDDGDAVFLARTPVLDRLASTCPTTALRAHGLAVGLPSDEDMGNSEVGHNALGAGRVFEQGAKLVQTAIETGAMFEGPVWKALTERVRASGQPLHFLGLLSDGNVHSHIDHLFAMIRRAHAENVQAVRVHVLLDGRDVPETSALDYVEPLERLLAELCEAGRDYRIASGGGRMFLTMDRYNADWAMVDRGWKHHVLGEGRGFRTTREAIETFRHERAGVIDQDLPGFVIVDESGAPVGPVRDGAAVVFFNFRGDRAIEISRAFTEKDFFEFPRGERPDVLYAGMMQYDGDLKLPKDFLVDPPLIDRTMGEYLVRNGCSIFACSETQKYGHVTYFWNGNRSGMFDRGLETYLEVPSDNVSFDQRPWMKAAEITDATIAALLSGKSRALRINFANGDMVGHTGVLESAVLAVQTVDICLARILPVIEKLGGAAIITADHGNADEMFERDKKTKQVKRGKDGRIAAKTSHTLNHVPFHLFAPGYDLRISEALANPGLANVAATTFHLLGWKAPDDYEPSILG